MEDRSSFEAERLASLLEAARPRVEEVREQANLYHCVSQAAWVDCRSVDQLCLSDMALAEASALPPPTLAVWVAWPAKGWVLPNRHRLKMPCSRGLPALGLSL